MLCYHLVFRQKNPFYFHHSKFSKEKRETIHILKWRPKIKIASNRKNILDKRSIEIL